MKTKGTIVGINANMITVACDGNVKQNEVGYAILKNMRLKAEITRIKRNNADLQVFEDTRGLKQGDLVEFTGELLSVELGPGLLGNVVDGLQNPLYTLAENSGYFLERGNDIPGLSRKTLWEFTPIVGPGDAVQAGDVIGTVPEGIVTHKIVIPFNLSGQYKVVEIVPPGSYGVKEKVATVQDDRGVLIPITMTFKWPVKVPITAYAERLFPCEPLLTKIRIIDTLFPVAKGGTYCIPGPFGAGKTVLHQITSRNAKVDIVIMAACGERAGEVVETIKEFPDISDPLTGKSLMERTIIVCNTSSMPVAAREASVYTAITMAEYYRQMGLDVLLLADSTSRWAQAMRERSGRLEEIPGEEAFPAYLESVVARFYERAGLVRLKDGGTGSITIGGTVSPAGGNIEEPVTQATLKVVGAFHCLSRERSDARRYPAIDPLESWSKYAGIIDAEKKTRAISLLSKATEIDQMMKVVGEEGTSLNDYILYLKGQLFDDAYLQQNGFDPVDQASSEERQSKTFSLMDTIFDMPFLFTNKQEAREVFHNLRMLFLDYNSSPWNSAEMIKNEKSIRELLLSHMKEAPEPSALHLRQALMESDLESQFERPKKPRTIRREAVTMVKEEDEEDIR